MSSIKTTRKTRISQFFTLIILLGLGGATWAADVHYDLTSRMNGQQTLSDGTTIQTWGFDLGSGMHGTPEVPGPIIYANEGDRIFLHFTNRSMEPHTIHPHGLDVDQQNDGVPQTSFEVPMMGTYTYEFMAPHAGSYAYHCHVETILHLQMGMYGAINILPPDGSNHAWDGGPAFDFERTWISAEIDRTWNQQQLNADFTIFEPDYFLVNGKDGADIATDPYTTFDIPGGETVLLRLVNMGYLPVRYDFANLWTSVIASDGRPLPESNDGDGLQVAPGERYDVLVRGSLNGSHVVRLEYLDLYDGHVVGTAQVPVSVTGAPTDVDGGVAGLLFSVSMPTPSPTSGSASFNFRLLRGGRVEIWVFDLRGRMLRKEEISAGVEGVYSWDGKDSQGRKLSSGIYYFRFRHGNEIVSRKVTLLR
jgi:FtsP/CotA-like multicopper oxidase with cupredoxin domain